MEKGALIAKEHFNDSLAADFLAIPGPRLREPWFAIRHFVLPSATPNQGSRH